jgi:hypothetical protein
MRLLLLLAVPLFAGTPCADMARLPDVTAAAQTATPCRVSFTLRPSADSEIKSEVWLPPANGWNGKFLMEGGGGFVGSVNTRGMTNAVKEGYASASTDTGHAGGSGSFALGHPEKIADFAFRAVHETAVKAKALIAAYYGRAPRLSYWEGCSTGGRQGLMSAQRYPEDFDAIIAGAPANNQIHLCAWRMRLLMTALKSPQHALPPEKLKLLNDAVLDKCDANDGVKDRLLEDPRNCKFDPSAWSAMAPKPQLASPHRNWKPSTPLTATHGNPQANSFIRGSPSMANSAGAFRPAPPNRAAWTSTCSATSPIKTPPGTGAPSTSKKTSSEHCCTGKKSTPSTQTWQLSKRAGASYSCITVGATEVRAARSPPLIPSLITSPS